MILGTIILLGIVYGIVQVLFPSLGLPDVSRKKKLKNVKVRPSDVRQTFAAVRESEPAPLSPRTPKGYQGRHAGD